MVPGTHTNISLSHDEILCWLGEYVSEKWSAEKVPLSGPRAHHALVEKFGKFSFQQFGVERFKEFLQPGVGKYFRMLIEGTRHHLYPVEYSGPTVVPKSAGHSRSNYLKPEIWDAFVRGFQHYFDRHLDQFRPGAVTDQNTQVAVPPISEQTQREWLVSFLREHSPLDAERLRGVLQDRSAGGYALMSLLPVDLRNFWKRHRFHKVVEVVSDWCNQNNVTAPIFSTSNPRQVDQQQKFGSRLQHGDGIRRAIFSALERMSTDELLRLAIPAGYFLPFLENDR